MNTPYRTRTELDLEPTVGSLAAHVTELEADNAALKRQLAEAWAAADTARAQRDRAMEESARLVERGSEALDQRDRARRWAVELEQQLHQVRAGLVAAAGDVRSFPERKTSEWVQGQYTELIDQLAIVLEVTGEFYPDREPVEAAEALAEAFERPDGAIEHAGQMLPEALDLDDEAREADRMEQIRNLAGYPHFGLTSMEGGAA